MKPNARHGSGEGIAILLVLALGGMTSVMSAVERQQSERAQPQLRNPSPLRMSVDLVRIDATVTDDRGRHVTDLGATDFEVLQDGRSQTISTFAYVRAGGVLADGGTPSAMSGPPTPSRPITPDQVRRTIAIIVDDLSLSFESTARVRDALHQFIATRVQPGDLVAILRTGAGMGALQQFTTDRRALHAAAERVRWNMTARVSPFEADNEIDRRIGELQTESFTAGTLGAIQYVVRGVSELPGRKSVVILSDGFRLADAEGWRGRLIGAMHSLLDAANRAGAVIYTMDTRGLVSTGPSAADGNSGDAVRLLNARGRELRDTQDGLALLAAETGGLFIRDTNDIAGGVQRILDDQQGYYLLGYVPQSSTFTSATPRFHTLTVRVKRPGLHVRSRRGFLGRADEASAHRQPENRMVNAVTSPFAGGGIRLRLSSFFGQVEKVGPVVQSYMHVDARDLTFVEQEDRTRSAQVEVLAVTFGDNGQVADEQSRRYTMKLTPERYERALASGFVYNMRVPVKRAGPYQLRIALRDVQSDRIGSASQFIDVPDVKKGRLTLSGLLIQGTTAGANGTADADDAVADADPNATVALRMFQQGTAANYFCYVYNARRGPSGQPHVESEVRLYREGIEVFRGAPLRIQPIPGLGTQTAAAGMLRFGDAFSRGSYVLEIAVTDRLAKKAARATQTIDFDVIE